MAGDLNKLPDGIGERDHLAFGLCMPDPSRILFRDRDGKETELTAYDLIEIGTKVPSFIRHLLEHEHRKKKPVIDP